MMSVRPVCVLLLAVFTPEVLGVRTKYGCVWPHEGEHNYEYATNYDGTPAFEMAHIPAFILDTPDQLRLFEAEVQNIFDATLVHPVFNTFDDYIEAYQTYAHGFNTFADFYSAYKVPYRPTTGSVVSNLMRLFDALDAAMPGISQYSYLVTASTDVTLSDEDIMSPDYRFKHNHIAGVIKLSLQQRLVYMVFDPASGFGFHTVMTTHFPTGTTDYALLAQYSRMHIGDVVGAFSDEIYGLAPGTQRSPGDSGPSEEKWVTFKMVSPGGPFIRATPQTNRGQGYGSQYVTEKSVIYYVEHPFCSFMETTLKPALLQPLQSIVQRQALGDIRNSITLQMVSELQNPILTFGQNLGNSFLQSTFWSLREQYPQTLEPVLNILAEMQMSMDTLQKYRTDLSEISRDSFFLLEVSALHISINANL